MLFSLIGFIMTAIYTASGEMEAFFLGAGFEPDFGLSLGFAFCLVFIMIFLGSFVSMTPSDEEIRSYK